MKKLLVIGWLVAGAFAAHAQGSVRFANVGGLIRPGQAGPIMYSGVFPPRPASGAAFLAQLQVKLDGTWTDVGTASPFRTGAAAGYWTAADLTIPGVAGGETATLRAVAWVAEFGSSFSAAMAYGWGGVGYSSDLTVVLGGAGDPPTLPAQLTTLTPFSILVAIPEPSIAALGLLGAGLLRIRRKRSSL